MRSDRGTEEVNGKLATRACSFHIFLQPIGFVERRSVDNRPREPRAPHLFPYALNYHSVCSVAPSCFASRRHDTFFERKHGLDVENPPEKRLRLPNTPIFRQILQGIHDKKRTQTLDLGVNRFDDFLKIFALTHTACGIASK